MAVSDFAEVGLLRKILPDEAVGVLVESPFPRMVGLGEVARHTQHPVDECVLGELICFAHPWRGTSRSLRFLAVVVGERVDFLPVWVEGCDNGRADRQRTLVADLEG